jgi:hypothetical protein
MMQLSLGVATTPAGKVIEETARVERDVYEFEYRQRADENRRIAMVAIDL